jgi:hypothetical protein
MAVFIRISYFTFNPKTPHHILNQDFIHWHTLGGNASTGVGLVPGHSGNTVIKHDAQEIRAAVVAVNQAGNYGMIKSRITYKCKRRPF